MIDDGLQVTVAASSREEADRITRRAVDERVAACAQVLGPVRSTYRWKGRVEQAEEWLCILKTTRARYGALEERVRAEHSYDNPEIIATAIVAGSAEYLAWLRAELTSPIGGAT